MITMGLRRERQEAARVAEEQKKAEAEAANATCKGKCKTMDEVGVDTEPKKEDALEGKGKGKEVGEDSKPTPQD